MMGPLPADRVESALNRMLDAQAHRGPSDAGGVVFARGDHQIGLGNRRLAIVDLSPLGHQPMKNPDTGDVLVYNGEIYNAVEMRSDLESVGYRFRGRSDTEVLLRAYQHYGHDCLDRLRGMFAFGLWDASTNTTFLARDCIGIKPLYYVRLAKGFLFGSEIRALLASGLLEPEVDRAALAAYFAYGSVQEPLTIIQGVRCLKPGSWMEVDPGGQIVQQGTYWEMPRPDPGARTARRPEDLKEEGSYLLQQAVRRHLISDAPLGIFLSSGLDSTAVLGLARKANSGPVHSFTVSFPEHPHLDEGPIARLTAERLQSIHHEHPMTFATALSWLKDGLGSMDQPAMDGMNTYIVSRAVREAGLVVALTGQGGDEIFGGYRSFRGIPRWQRRLRPVQFLPTQIRKLMFGLAAWRMNSLSRQKVREIAATEPTLLNLYFRYRRLFSDRDIGELGIDPISLGLDTTFQVADLDYLPYLVDNQQTGTIARLETGFYLRNTLLRDGDVYGMANSIEIRPPFLDRDILDWTFGLPDDLLLPPGAPDKFLLRLACGEFYNEHLAQRPKQGFELPVSEWLLGPLRDRMEDSLGAVKASSLVDPAGVEKMRRTFLAGTRSAGWSVWTLMTLGQWLQSVGRAIPTNAK